MVLFTTIDDSYSTEIGKDRLAAYPDSLLAMMARWEPNAPSIKVRYLTAENLDQLAHFYTFEEWTNPWMADSNIHVAVTVEGVDDYIWNYCNLPFEMLFRNVDDSSESSRGEDWEDDFNLLSSDSEDDNDFFY